MAAMKAHFVSAAAFIKAAEQMDWQQVVLNGGPPCFYYDKEESRFCGRAQRWHNHEGEPHMFVPFADLLRTLNRIA